MRAFFLTLILLSAYPHAYCLADKMPVCEALPKSPPSPSLIIDHYVTDAVLKCTWALVVDCAHPHWPPRIRDVPSGADTDARPRKTPPSVTSASVRSPDVQRGSRVDLWSEGSPAIRLSGVALESAAVGQQIKVRAGLGINPLCGKVSGPGSVELIGIDKMCRREP
jgi:hypothetical protein